MQRTLPTLWKKMNRVLMKYSSLRRSVISKSHLLNGGPPPPSIQPASPLPTTAFRHLFTRRREMGCCELPRPLLSLGLTRVPEERAYLIERNGEYTNTLRWGYHLLDPFRDRIAHVQSLAVKVVQIPPDQPLVTKDNVGVFIGGNLHIKVVDPYRASYCAEKRTARVMLELVRAALSRELGKRTRLEALTSLETLGPLAIKALNEAEVRDQGLELTDLKIDYFEAVSPEDKGYFETVRERHKEEGASGPMDLVKTHLRKISEEKKKKKQQQNDGTKA